jgi:hypothetical protein
MVRVLPQGVHVSKKMSENTCTYPTTKCWRKSNYTGDEKIANKITQWIDFQ